MKTQLSDTDLLTSPHWDGEKYNQISSPQFNINRAFIAEHPFKKDACLLDVGCGSGQTTQLLAALAPQGQAIGIDASAAMIQSALDINALSHLQFAVCNGQEMAYQNQFDVVSSFFCLQWIPQKVFMFKKIYQALKTHGQFLFIVPMPHATLPAIRKRLMTSDAWRSYFTDYVDPLAYVVDCDYEEYAKQAGFAIESYRIEPSPVFFDTYEQFFAFMMQMTPHISQIPLWQDKEQFVHELLEYYLQDKNNLIETGYQLTFHLVKGCVIK